MYILSLLNKTIPKIIDGKLNPVRLDLADYISSRFCRGNMYYPSVTEINDFKKKFLDSQKWIADNFWNGSFELWGPSLSPNRFKHQESVDCIERMSGDRVISSLISCLGSVWTDKVGR